jgi:hypothetical protein
MILVGVLDHEDVEDLRLPRLQLELLPGMLPRPDERHIGIPVGIPGAGRALPSRKWPKWKYSVPA